MLQRLISSHPEAFIWGEHEGHLRQILEGVGRLVEHTEWLGDVAREEFATQGYQGFMANLLPPPIVMSDAFGVFMARIFRKPGTRVWGFKEVRYDQEFCVWLQKFLPGTRVVFVVRDPRDVLCSLDEWERAGWWESFRTVDALEHWKRIAASFLETTSVPVLTFRYEDFVQDPEGTVERLGEFASLDPRGFDLSVFGVKVHNLGASWERELRKFDDLPPRMHALLEDEGLRTTAKAYDYRL